MFTGAIIVILTIVAIVQMVMIGILIDNFRHLSSRVDHCLSSITKLTVGLHDAKVDMSCAVHNIKQEVKQLSDLNDYERFD